MNDSVTELIGKLLRQAEGTTHAGEAEAFMDKAMLLAARHDVDLAVARAGAARSEERSRPEERTIHIGTAGMRGLGQYVRLYLQIAEAFSVKCFIARNSTAVYAHGFAVDLDVTEQLYESLLIQMVRAGDRYLRSGGHREEVAVVVDRRGRRQRRPVHGATARRLFYQGFAAEVGQRLAAAQAQAVAEAEQDAAQAQATETENLPISVALALRERSSEVEQFFEEQRRARRIRATWQGDRTTAFAAGPTDAGREAGARADLHQRQQRRRIERRG